MLTNPLIPERIDETQSYERDLEVGWVVQGAPELQQRFPEDRQGHAGP